MCMPVGAMMGLSALSGGLNIMGQDASRKAMARHQDQMAASTEQAIAENRMFATQAYLDNVRQEHLQEAQQREGMAERGHDMQKEAMRAQASAKVAAAEGGVGGVNLQQLVHDFSRQEAVFLGRLNMNQQFEDQARVERIHNYGQQFQQRSAAIKPYMRQALPPVDYFGPLLNIGATGLRTHYEMGQAEQRAGHSPRGFGGSGFGKATQYNAPIGPLKIS